VLAIGDIHGCLSHFQTLLQGVAPAPDDHIILLGDYVNRGSNSAGVLQLILELAKTHQVSAIKGNHEQMMLDARSSHDKYSDWLKNGADKTLLSYAGPSGSLSDVPESHWQFLETQLVNYVETPSHIFVHASAYPDFPMPDQPEYMLRWERFDNITPHESGKPIIAGHTPQKSGRPLNKGFAICIDTNACRGGLLTCLDVNSGRLWQSNAQGQITKAHISDFSDES
jgi:serine/threonine protein phosphatase 1